MRKGGTGERRLLGALLASAALHVIVLAALVVARDPLPEPPPARPAVEITLLRPERTSRSPLPLTAPAEAFTDEARRDAATPAARTVQPPRSVSSPFPGVEAFPVSPGGTSPGPATQAPGAPASPTPPAPAVSPSPRLSGALRAADCDERGRRANRDGCDERMGAVGRAAAPLGPDPDARLQAEAAARTAAVAAREAARLRPLPLGACPSCGGMGVVSAEGPPTNLSDNGVKIPFGRVPPAITSIPPSTLRGDDDALRPKPRP